MVRWWALIAVLAAVGCDDNTNYSDNADAGVDAPDTRQDTGETGQDARDDTGDDLGLDVPDGDAGRDVDPDGMDVADADGGDAQDAGDAADARDTDMGDMDGDGPADADADPEMDPDTDTRPDAPVCDDLQCARECPFGYWDDLDGCPTCACAPPPTLFFTGRSEHDHVTLDTTPSIYIGGIDRWVFDFRWLYDDPMIADEAEQVDMTVRWMQGVGMDPTEQNATFWMDDPGPVEAWSALWTLFGFGLQTADLVVESGYFSLRRVDGRFEGGLYMELRSDGQQFPGIVRVGGAFDVPVP